MQHSNFRRAAACLAAVTLAACGGDSGRTTAVLEVVDLTWSTSERSDQVRALLEPPAKAALNHKNPIRFASIGTGPGDITMSSEVVLTCHENNPAACSDPLYVEQQIETGMAPFEQMLAKSVSSAGSDVIGGLFTLLSQSSGMDTNVDLSVYFVTDGYQRTGWMEMSGLDLSTDAARETVINAVISQGFSFDALGFDSGDTITIYLLPTDETGVDAVRFEQVRQLYEELLTLTGATIEVQAGVTA